MATYSWPTTKAFQPQDARWRQVLNQRANTSALSGYTQVLGMPGTRWAVTLDMPRQSYAERLALKAFLDRLEGRAHLVDLFDWVRPTPAGTISLSGVTVNSTAAQFGEQVVLAGCGAGATLLPGDWMVIAGQRLCVVAPATANGSGVMTVEVRHRLRQAIAAGTPVALDRPRAPMMLNISGAETVPVPFSGNGTAPAFTLDFVERWT